jgi:Zn-dependent M32 family carboxypeptidase
MKNECHYDTSETERVQIRKVIADLGRTVQLLGYDIAAEEERTGISDRSEAAYSLLAKMLATRRDNLRDTISALERRLSKFSDRTELVAELA